MRTALATRKAFTHTHLIPRNRAPPLGEAPTSTSPTRIAHTHGGVRPELPETNGGRPIVPVGGPHRQRETGDVGFVVVSILNASLCRCVGFVAGEPIENLVFCRCSILYASLCRCVCAWFGRPHLGRGSIPGRSLSVIHRRVCGETPALGSNPTTPGRRSSLRGARLQILGSTHVWACSRGVLWCATVFRGVVCFELTLSRGWVHGSTQEKGRIGQDDKRLVSTPPASKSNLPLLMAGGSIPTWIYRSCTIVYNTFCTAWV